MKMFFIVFALCFSSLVASGQKLKLEKASPFIAVKWEENQPIVKFKTQWYALEKLDIYTTKQILDFCKSKFGTKWKRRFSEDLIEVLKGMGAHPNENVNLLLNDGTQKHSVTGTYTIENRQKVWKYNNAAENIGIKKVTAAQAIEDILEFQRILEERSSYVQLTDYDYNSAINVLKTAVKASKNDNVNVNYLTHELAKIMAEIGDRHSSIKNEAFKKEEHPTYKLQLPFSLAALNGKFLALKRIDKDGVYVYLHTEFPYVKSINGRSVDSLMEALVYKSKKAPKAAKIRRGLSEIQILGRLYFTNNLILPNEIEIVFSNGKTDKKEQIQLQKEDFRYYSKLERDKALNAISHRKGDLKHMSKKLDDTIGYIAIPEMYHYEDISKLERYIDSVLTDFSDTKALIIDLRFNPGGGRDLIKTIARYIIPKSESPWVANIAYLRTDMKSVTHKSMSNRLLYKYASKMFSAIDREAIDTFNEGYTTYRTFDTAKFSDSHYMILKSGKQHYTKPVYIVVNEASFSAATVFASAFKGLPNVKIVGITTDGSSGNSKTMHLQNSNIRVKVSTMLSFQRNGRTLDGNGTAPDIYLPYREVQILKGQDSQLEQLIEILKREY